MFISSKQLQEIIETNKAQQAQIEALTAQVSFMQRQIENIKYSHLLTDGEVEALTEQLINNDSFTESLASEINDYLGDNLDSEVSTAISNNTSEIRDIVESQFDNILHYEMEITVSRR
jgi:hypothetical protein